ncbi:putative RNB domain-containing protein [Colletotrichum karsti]|uniref:RNB domain-containing protein n=1 Tax=Colletotrichum karsti TaxID=1095194 RepID=A0A9P6LP08_9PEZI|nr:putative RNB domain-containing protein [Colletotrichum karsti]KAF9879107.1 putative RNB domain-containing protein [Colletotrichum karsti]
MVKFLDETLPEEIPARGGNEMEHRNKLIEDVQEGIKEATMSVRLMPYTLSRIDWSNPRSDPIFRQFIPTKSIMQPDHPKLTLDSLEEEADSPVEGLVHRYPDKALFLLGGETDEVKQKKSLKPTPARWKACFEHIEATPEIQDIVVSGGDSYYLTPPQIVAIGKRLISIPHIRRFRFASKGLAVSPTRILDPDDEWFRAIVTVSNLARKAGKQMALHTHFNHPNEISWVTEEACQKLFEAAVTVRNQSVLLNGVNDDVPTMAKLIRKLADNNITPYYVYQHDMVRKAEHLRTPLQTILDIEAAIRGSIAGFMMPQFVVDLPGGGGKRLASTFMKYDRQTGVSTYMAPAVTGHGVEGRNKTNKVYEYHDPVLSLPAGGDGTFTNRTLRLSSIDRALPVASWSAQYRIWQHLLVLAESLLDSGVPWRLGDWETGPPKAAGSKAIGEEGTRVDVTDIDHDHGVVLAGSGAARGSKLDLEEERRRRANVSVDVNDGRRRRCAGARRRRERRRGQGEKEKLQVELQLQLQRQGQYHRQPRGPWTAATTAVDRHELISFLDDADADDLYLSCPPVADNNVPLTTCSSVLIIDTDTDEEEEDDNDDKYYDNDDDNTKDDVDYTATTTNESFPRYPSFYSSARSSLESTDLTTCSSASATTTTTTVTMAPLFLMGGGVGAKNNGKTTAPAETTASIGRASDDSVDRFDGLWDYLHHGLDGYSSPDLRLLQYQDKEKSPAQQQQQQRKQQQQQQQHYQQHSHQHQLSSSSTYHQTLYELRPESSRSHTHPHFLHRTSSESGGAATTTTTTTGTWTLRKSHEKTNSGSSKKTTATTASTAMTTIPSARERDRERETTRSPDGSAVVVPPPVSPSTASFGAEMSKEEFEALPEAIQRKYFSSLERLHFASLAPAPPQTPNFLNPFFERPETSPNPQTQTIKQRRKARQARLASDHVSDRVKRRNSRRSRITSTGSSVYVRLPDKIKRRHLTTEEQLASSLNRRHDIILDPADEAIYKVRRRASSVVIPDDLWSPTLSVRPQTMESQPSQREVPKKAVAAEQKRPSPKKQTSLPTSPQKKRDSFYDSFRWLEEDDELDLRLHLDDYHANLREEVPAPSKQRRPSFRRHLSISKIPFGRTSLSMNRPGTTQAIASSPGSPLFANAPSSPQATSPGHGRRRSRALSLITPKHSPQDTVAAFDPEAAHYQDPEARLKLRLYLASPQKFDEAIEFGFPAKEAMCPEAAKNVRDSKFRRSKAALADEPDNLGTFLADDRSSIYSEDGSLDSDSPKTPQTMENATALRPPPVKSDRGYSPAPLSPKPSNEFTRGPAETREMTMRMTLTRPDLRAHEDQIYGWQQKCCPPGRKSQSNGLRDEFGAPAFARDGTSKESIERQFAAMDQWNAQANDRGVMKRFWNKLYTRDTRDQGSQRPQRHGQKSFFRFHDGNFGGNRGGGQHKGSMELSASELSIIRSRSNIRERLRAWESENHIPASRLLGDVPTRDIPLSNYLTRPDQLPGSTEAMRGKDSLGSPEKSQGNRALYDGDELEDLRGATSALVAGDLVVTRLGLSRLPILALCLGRHYDRQYFYMSTGEVVVEENLPTLFTLTNFIDPAKFQHVVDIIPDQVYTNPRNVLFHRKNPEVIENVALLQGQMIRFREDMISFYQAHQQLDNASSFLADPETPQYMSLEEIADKLLPSYLKTNDKYPPHALYAVHSALQRDEWGFRPLSQRWHRRNYIYEIRPASDIRVLRKTENQVRELIEGAALRENPAQSASLLSKNSLGSFILKARGIIQASRANREWTPHGMIGLSNEKTESRGVWNKSDQDFIRFMELWACHRIVPNASQLETLGSTILRLTDMYTESEWLAHWTGFTFLQEIGWIPPWDIPARYDYKFPGTKVQRGAPMKLPPVDVQGSLRQDVAGGVRRDWGDATIFCVDAESTEDVDDGFSIEPTEKPGEYWIHIHIADPASCIDPNSDLARRIQHTPSSLYLPGFPEKMLPVDLEEQFSLDPGSPTLTFSAKVNELGQVLDHNVEPGIARRVLHVPKSEVAAVLPGLHEKPAPSESFSVGTPPAPRVPLKTITRASDLPQKDKDDLVLINRLCKALGHRRTAKGQMPVFPSKFKTPEVSLHSVSAVGDPDDLGASVSWAGDPFIRISDPTPSETEDLVAHLMHTAGEVAATWCAARKIPIPYSTQPEAQRNRAELDAFRRQHVDPLIAQRKPVPTETIFKLYSLVGTTELSIDPSPFYSVGLDAYSKSSSPLRRFGDLLVHWQIHAALAHERATGRSLAGHDASHAPFLPWTRAALAPALPMLQAQQRQIKQVDNKDGPTQWTAQAFLRAWRFREADLPPTFTFVVDGLYPFGLRGRLVSFYEVFASIDIVRLDGFAKMADIRVDDLFEVEVVDVNVVTTFIAVQPLKRLGSLLKPAAKSA